MIDSKTDLYAIFGNPVQHSKSPVIHNAWFDQYKINAAYMAFKIKNIADAVKAVKILNIKGASVTIPFKKSVIDYLDMVDKNALNIGAVNTIVNKKGKLYGFNTDYKAAIEPLKPFGIKNKTVCIIGAGGAASAVAYGINKEKGNLLIVNRSVKKGRTLSLKYGGRFISMEDLKNIYDFKADIIINTTPVGMYPDVEDSPFLSRLLKSEMIVMDIIYNPVQTNLLINAKNKGCTIIDGLSMFMHQGAAQFKLWTGIRP